MKASDLLIACLEQEGVEYIFGLPGEENLDLLDSIRQSQKIKLILTRHEQAAAFMAATYGRLTGKPGVVLTTLGPGATNLLTGIAYATHGGMPLVAITGQKGITHCNQGLFQRVDIVNIMKPITKMSRQIDYAFKIPVFVSRAFRIARQERPGAVLLELPEDIAKNNTSQHPLPLIATKNPYPPREMLSKACELIQNAHHPLILIGFDATRTKENTGILQFIEKTQLPFITTQMGKGVVNETHPLYLGSAALSENDYIHCAIESSDCIISIGHSVLEKPPFLQKIEQNNQILIHINYSESLVSTIYHPSYEVIGDIDVSMTELTQAIAPSPSWDTVYFKRVSADLKKRIEQHEQKPRFPVKVQYLIGAFKKLLPDNGVITLDNGIYKIWMSRNFPAKWRHHLLLDNALATMGAGLPSAIAAKLVYKDRPVIALCGDGGFMMNSQELETAKRLGLNLLVIVLNDNAFGMIKWKQHDMGMENFGLDYTNPDFVQYAKSYGTHGYRLKKEDVLEKVLKEHLSLPGVRLLEIPVDYSENQEILSKELKTKVCVI